MTTNLRSSGRGGRRFVGLCGLSITAFGVGPALAQMSSAPDRTPPPYVAVVGPRPALRAVTMHEGRFEGQATRYKAVVGETFVPGPDNKAAAATMVSIAYVRTDVKTPDARPVIFLFNGGPGASSTPLQGALAPRVPAAAGGPYVDNPDSLLDAADLVFVDPVGAGLSRALPGSPAEQFWATKADAQSFRYFIQTWLKENKRETSPRYIVGESYGTARAGHIAELGADLHLDGIVLISSVGFAAGQDLPYVLSFPTFAAAAAYHGKAASNGRTPEQIFTDNIRFARGPYLAALVQGDELPADQRDAMASEVAQRLGLDRSVVLANDLRLGKEDFMLNLLKADGRRTGQLDSRVTGDLATFAQRHPPYDDPSMSLGKSTNTPDAPAGNPGEKAYLQDELGYRTADDYIGLNLKLLFSFKHDVDWSYRPTDAIAELMKTQPKLRLMQAGGIYDITTPFYGALYNLAHSGLPRDRVTVAPFVSGHEVYAGGNRKAFVEAIHAFVLPTGHP